MYCCPKCGYTTDRRCNYIAHVRRKKPCSHDPEDDSRPEVLPGRQARTSCNTGSNIRCEVCDAQFSHRSALSRHRSRFQHHPSNDRLKILEDEIKGLRQELRDRPISLTNNNTNNNNNNIHFHINAFGKEDMSSLTPEILTQCIKRTTKGLVELVEHVHFNDHKNRNLRATLEHPEHVEYFDGEKWKFGMRSRLMRDVVDSGHNILSEHYENNGDAVRQSMTTSLFNFVASWMKKMDRTNASTYAEAMNEVYCCVLNRTRELCEDLGPHRRGGGGA